MHLHTLVRYLWAYSGLLFEWFYGKGMFFGDVGGMVDQIGGELVTEEALYYRITVFLFLDSGVVCDVDVLFEVVVFELCVADLAGNDELGDEDVVWVVVDDCGFVAEFAAGSLFWVFVAHAIMLWNSILSK